MHINALSTPMMLNLSARWLGDESFVAVLHEVGPLGLGVYGQLDKGHTGLADIEQRRTGAEASLRALIDQATAVDNVHDRKARAVNYHLRGLIEGSDDGESVARYRRLEARLFPQGLRVIRLPYIEEGGAAVALDSAVGIEQRTLMAALTVGEHTLLTLFEAWMKAGHELGELVSARAKLQAKLIRERSDAGTLDIKAARSKWMQAVRGLLWALDVDEGLAPLSDRVIAPLTQATQGALRRRAGELVDADEQNLEADDEHEQTGS